MKKLLIATSNPGKLEEIKRFLSDLPLEIISLADIGLAADAPETGKTFEKNAVMKAKYYTDKSHLPTIADDGGFEIDALCGEPGVRSHRWIHKDREDTDEELIQYTLNKMNKLPLSQRGAQLRVVIAFSSPDGKVITSEASIRGIIPLKPSNHRTPGYPYRSLLFIPKMNKFYDHRCMTQEEVARYNHRRKAINILKPYIIEMLAKI